jgi:hypothetical protein
LLDYIPFKSVEVKREESVVAGEVVGTPKKVHFVFVNN